MDAALSTTVRAVAIPRLDPGAVGIHLAWSGPEASPLARGGYEVRRRQHRESRSIIYTARYDALRGLVQFLLEDCCGGHPEICAPAVSAVPCCG